MVKKKTKYNKKLNIFFKKIRNKKYIVIGFILLIIVFLILFQKYKKNDTVVVEDIKSNLDNKQVKSINITKEEGQVILDRYSNMYKNAVPFFEESFKNEEQEKIWNFIRNNTLPSNNINRTDNNFVPLVIKSNKSEYNINLSGFDIYTGIYQKGVERLDLVNKIGNFLINLGYKKMEDGSKTDLYELVETYENKGDFFIKGDQLVRIYYQNDDCYEDMYGGCYIRLTYVNNIEKQIDSQSNILNKLIDNNGSIGLFFSRTAASSLINGGYLIDGFELDKNYAYIRVGKYNSDYEGCLFKINSQGKFEIALPEWDLNNSFITLSEKGVYPKEILCWFYLPREMPPYQSDEYSQTKYYQSVMKKIDYCK